MRRVFRVGILLLAVLGLVGGGIFLVQQKKEELSRVPNYASRPRPVTVSSAEKGNLVVEKHYLAVVEPFREARVSARVTAMVEKIRVDEGDRVEIGDVLVELDAEAVEYSIDAVSSRIDQAEAELAANRATVEALKASYDYWRAEKNRALALVQKGAMSRSETEDTVRKAADIRGKLTAGQQQSRAITKEMDALRKQKAELDAQRGYYTLTSPFAGWVSQRLVDPGDMASPSLGALITVQDASALKVAFDVPQKDLPAVKEGLVATFHANGRCRRSKINVMHPAVDEAKMMRAEIWLDEDDPTGFTPGVYLPITVIMERLKDVVLVPASAVIEGPHGDRYVFAVAEDRIAAKPVQVLGRSADMVAVTNIDAETLVVKHTYLGWAVLSSGQKVEAVQ
ncbi:MAG: efflux RND transporter periplasmic adaptor subunit [Planctomycetota bacterium]